ncbi:hypothetical protein [Dactylosporangium sp. CA-139066]|uniref:hypothetical protein n=1 Tax=Dactylosporangium sp. CA-139066 TaxID=3239930 RepID=UPI003D933AB6
MVPNETRPPWWRTWALPVFATPPAVAVGLAIGLLITRDPGPSAAAPPVPAVTPASAAPAPATPAAAIAGRWSTCAAQDDSLTITADGTAAYTGSPGRTGEATLRITATGGHLVAVVERSTVNWLPVGQVNDLDVAGDRIIATVDGKNPWYLVRWGVRPPSLPDGPCGG